MKKYPEYIPTPEEVERVDAWVKEMEGWIVPQSSKVTQPVNWERFNEAYEKHIGFSRGVPLGQVQSFYQSKYFGFYIKRDGKLYTPNLIYFHTEKAYNKWRKKNRFLVNRCIIGSPTTTGKRYVAAYYHRDYGEVGWLQAKLQYFVNRFESSNNLVKWFYNLERKSTKFKINLSWGD